MWNMFTCTTTSLSKSILRTIYADASVSVEDMKSEKKFLQLFLCKQLLVSNISRRSNTTKNQKGFWFEDPLAAGQKLETNRVFRFVWQITFWPEIDEAAKMFWAWINDKFSNILSFSWVRVTGFRDQSPTSKGKKRKD